MNAASGADVLEATVLHRIVRSLDSGSAVVRLVQDGPLELNVLVVFGDAVFDSVLDDDRVAFFTAEIPVSFGLWIADDDSVGVLLFGESGIRGILTNDSAQALVWTEDQYEQVNQNADSVFFRGGSTHPSLPR